MSTCWAPTVTFLSFGSPPSISELSVSRRARLFAWMDSATANGGSDVWTTFTTALIIASFVCVLVQSFPAYRVPQPDPGTAASISAMDKVQLIVIAAFTLQFVVRSTCVDAFVSVQQRRLPPADRASVAYVLLIFLTRPLNVIDLAAIVPFYFSLAGLLSNSFSIVLMLRCFRVLLLSRLLSGKVARAIVMFLRVIRRSVDVLELMLTYLLVGCVLFGSLIFYCEQGSYDDASGTFLRPTVTGDVDGSTEVSPFTSIPQSMWWVVVTMSTVGYGDLFPTSGGGAKAVAGVCIVCGLLMIALPISILGTQFTKEYDEERRIIELYAAEARDQRLAALAALQLHRASATALRRAMSDGSLQTAGGVQAPRRLLNRMRRMSSGMLELVHHQLTVSVSRLKLGGDEEEKLQQLQQRPESMSAEEAAAAAILAQCSSEEAKVAVMLSAAARDDAERVLSLLQSGVSASAADYDQAVRAACGGQRGAPQLQCAACWSRAPTRTASTASATLRWTTRWARAATPACPCCRLTAHSTVRLSSARSRCRLRAAAATALLAEAASEEARIALLLFAASRDDADRCRLLLDSGLDPSCADYDRRSGLHVAASDAAVSVVRLLLERGAEVNCVDRFGRTPLDDAVASGAVENISGLQLRGARHSDGFLQLQAQTAAATVRHQATPSLNPWQSVRGSAAAPAAPAAGSSSPALSGSVLTVISE